MQKQPSKMETATMELGELKDHLAAKIKAVESIKEEIEECKKSQTEYQEIIKQWHIKGIFLSEQTPNKYLAIENAVLKIQISDLNKDFVSLQSKRVCNGQNSENSNEKIELEETFLALQKALDDKCKIQLENEAIKNEIKSLKNQVSRSRVQTVDVDDVIQDSLQLKAKLVQASCDTKVSLNEAHQSKKAVKPQKCLTLDQIERPLKFLNKHQHLSHQCQEYLRKMNVALLETLDIKEKLMTNGHKQNECLANRLADLVPNSTPNDFRYTPQEPQKLKTMPNFSQDPIV